MPQMLARYEFKYLITEEQRKLIREVARNYCVPDAFGVDGTYWVNSLYTDTTDYRTARETLAGIKNRFKSRMRTYGWKEDDPVFMELKRRVGTSIVKGRALVSRPVARAIALSSTCDRFDALKASHQVDLEDYRNMTDLLDLRPTVWVRYLREAWVSAFPDGARLTFDMHLQAQEPTDAQRIFEPPLDRFQMVRWDGAPMVLELKFNGAFPRWMHRIVHSLGLRRISFPKYVQCAQLVHEQPWARLERPLAGVLL